jgi:hypothetical protein
MSRSEHRANASRANGAKSGGPKTSAGKAKSAQNARTHGLTGKIDPSDAEAQFINRLAAALKERYASIASEQSTILVDIVLNAQMRLQRAYDLIQDRIINGDTPKSTRGQKQVSAEERALEVQLQLIEMTGDKRLGVKIPRLIAQLEGFSVEGRQSEATKLRKLVGYAQRFRGQRDRALLKLERMLGDPVPDLYPPKKRVLALHRPGSTPADEANSSGIMKPRDV